MSETLVEHLNNEVKSETKELGAKLELVPAIPTIELSVEHSKEIAEIQQKIQRLDQERQNEIVAARKSIELAEAKVNLALSQRETLLYKLGVIYGYNPETYAVQPPDKNGISKVVALPPIQMAPLPILPS